MKKIFIGTKNYTFPSKWNQLTKNQLLYVAHLLSQKFTKQEIVVMLTIYFSGLHVQQITRLNPLIFIELEHQYDFLFKDIKLTDNLLPTVRVKFKKFYGPTPGLSNMTYEQFIIFAETYYSQYVKSGEAEHLNLFIASLYTRNKNIFDSDLIEKNANTLSKLSTAEKTAILLFYQGSRSYLGLKFPKLFSKKEKNNSNKEYDFLGVIELLNKEDVSKNNTIRKTNIYEIFTRLTNLIKKENERKHNK